MRAAGGTWGLLRWQSRETPPEPPPSPSCWTKPPSLGSLAPRRPQGPLRLLGQGLSWDRDWTQLEMGEGTDPGTSKMGLGRDTPVTAEHHQDRTVTWGGRNSFPAVISGQIN